jgi:hypothetical protein
MVLAILMLAWWSSGNAHSQTPEYEVKAVFLERFTQFIEWPDAAGIADTSTPFVLGVFGDHRFGSILDEIYTNTRIRGKPVIVRYISDTRDIAGCQLLFIADTGNDTLADILAIAGKGPILTVGDAHGLAAQGVHIAFFIEDQKVRFEINETALHDSGLSVSTLLLRVARIVNRVRG